jgi:hypothetical protein
MVGVTVVTVVVTQKPFSHSHCYHCYYYDYP